MYKRRCVIENKIIMRAGLEAHYYSATLLSRPVYQIGMTVLKPRFSFLRQHVVLAGGQLESLALM